VIEIEKSISKRSILLIIYIVLIFFVGIIFVPCFEVWGPEKNISGYNYVFIFNSVVDRTEINGFLVLYQIDYLRIAYTIGIITLIFYSVWRLFGLWDQEDSR